MVNKSFKFKRFRNLGVLTITSVYFLILVGGVVRSTGSGMGCPDWPKCFGKWVPPTNINQLPEDYLRVYKDKRIQKNEKLAGYLNRLGFTQMAAEIFSHPSQFIETEFNVSKTWIEYLNRLVGAVIGILIFLTFIASFPFYKKDKVIVYLSLISVILVGFQGWLGSLVVSTNLLPVMITIHMALALVLVALLIYTIARSQNDRFRFEKVVPDKSIVILLYGTIFLSFVQILIGTQVREVIDMIAFELNYQSREVWVNRVGNPFYFHRSFSILILVLNVYVCWRIYSWGELHMQKLAVFLISLIGAEIVIGIVLSYFAIPAFLQPVHLLLATLLFGLQFYILISCLYAVRNRVLTMAIR